MKILIGTPVHEIKDYAMERWLESLAKLQKAFPTDLLIVDNSKGLSYTEKLKQYCDNLGVSNYDIQHVEVHQENGPDERIGRSREVIRQTILNKDYDAWFSWECDQIIPENALDILVKIMKNGNYMMVHSNSWARGMQQEPMAAFGCTLIHKTALEKYGFLLEYPNMPDSWHGGDVWFKKQVLNGGGSYVEVYGIIKPIYHLNS